MDRYLIQVGHWNFPRTKLCLLATTAIILAAKMEEKYAPNVEFTLEFLTCEEKEKVFPEDVFNLEAEVLMKLGFDLHFPGPVAPMDRYLHLLGYNKSRLMVRMTYQICKFAMNEPVFLNFHPSMIAACAAIICANIYERDKESFEMSGIYSHGKKPTENDQSFFQLSTRLSANQNQLLRFNSTVWNKKEIVLVTGYSYTSLKQCLHELALFIRESL